MATQASTNSSFLSLSLSFFYFLKKITVIFTPPKKQKIKKKSSQSAQIVSHRKQTFFKGGLRSSGSNKWQEISQSSELFQCSSTTGSGQDEEMKLVSQPYVFMTIIYFVYHKVSFEILPFLILNMYITIS